MGVLENVFWNGVTLLSSWLIIMSPHSFWIVILAYPLGLGQTRINDHICKVSSKFIYTESSEGKASACSQITTADIDWLHKEKTGGRWDSLGAG